MSDVKNQHSKELDFGSAIALMDDEIREDLHNKLAPCSEQEFFDAYTEAHKKKYGEEWELAKANPQW